jgi:saccharopine dehydrogenase-like NADP-dependent oxidoreductase
MSITVPTFFFLTDDFQAGGHVGKYFAEELLRTGKHTVTAITREGSTSKLPNGVKIARVNYDDEASLISALQGQQFLVITLAAQGPADTHSKLVAAAAKAGIPYVMPNNYGSDVENRKLCEENLYGMGCIQRNAEIEATGVCSWINMVCISAGDMLTSTRLTTSEKGVRLLV